MLTDDVANATTCSCVASTLDYCNALLYGDIGNESVPIQCWFFLDWPFRMLKYKYICE